MGFNIKYDGTNNENLIHSQKLDKLKKMVNLIPICPESFGGLECPRPPCEINGDSVVTQTGKDCTKEFKKGAQEALKAAKIFNCHFALLKEKSPSCGFGQIYDGSFSHTVIKGSGLTAQMLAENGLKIYGETQIDELLEALRLAKAPNQLSFEF